MFFAPKVDSILASFQKTVAKLEAAAERHLVHAVKLGDVIQRKRCARDQHMDERKRALNAAEKISNLLA